MLVMSTVLENQTPFNTLFGYALLMGEDGTPMHKSKGNLVVFDDAAERVGSDTMQEFLEDLSNWYLRRSRERFWKTGMDNDKVAAYLTLYECLTTLLILLAPIMPFITEKIYQNLVRSVNTNAPSSVHLCDWPKVNEELLDERLSSETQLVMRVVSLGRAAREKAQIKVRQPLNALYIRVLNRLEEEALVRHSDQVLEELNIKHLHLMSDDSDMLAYTLKPQVKVLGPKYGPLVQKILTTFKSLDNRGAHEATNRQDE